MNVLYYPILVPLAAGVLCLFFPEKLKAIIKAIALICSAAFFGIAIWLFNVICTTDYLAKDGLSTFILLAIGLFGIATVLYSLKYMSGRERQREYYSLILLTLAGAATTVLANNLIVLLVGWGFLGITLYLLIATSGPDAATAAKKTLIVVGGTDALMVMGVVIVAFLAGQWTMSEIAKAPLAFTTAGPGGGTVTSGVAVIGFLFLALACFAKAGAMPLHTWIPDMAETSPATVTAFLPASLDKLLGIYLLAKVSTQLFVFTTGWGIFLMIVGAVTILGAVMMALVQHDLRKLLSYHAVSQVGYMVLGIGTGNPIGIAGGIFHMLNHSIYKSCLFFCGGAVENRTGTNDLDKLGGLARYMPITFAACLVAALSISGVPPFNGFFSKWMVYQGVVELGKSGGSSWVIWLVAAMFGSALTLASFTKLIYAIFLGQKPPEQAGVREVSFLMWVPMAALALLCIVFGVFAKALPIKYFIIPGISALLGSDAKFAVFRRLVVRLGDYHDSSGHSPRFHSVPARKHEGLSQRQQLCRRRAPQRRDPRHRSGFLRKREGHARLERHIRRGGAKSIRSIRTGKETDFLHQRQTEGGPYRGAADVPRLVPAWCAGAVIGPNVVGGKEGKWLSCISCLGS